MLMGWEIPFKPKSLEVSSFTCPHNHYLIKLGFVISFGIIGLTLFLFLFHSPNGLDPKMQLAFLFTSFILIFKKNKNFASTSSGKRKEWCCHKGFVAQVFKNIYPTLWDPKFDFSIS